MLPSSVCLTLKRDKELFVFKWKRKVVLKIHRCYQKNSFVENKNCDRILWNLLRKSQKKLFWSRQAIGIMFNKDYKVFSLLILLFDVICCGMLCD